MFTIHAKNLCFNVNDHASTGAFSSVDGIMRGYVSDFWRILIEKDGEQLQLSSARQQGDVTFCGNECMRIMYPQLFDDYGNEYAITLTIEVCVEKYGLAFRSDLRNNTRDVTVLQCSCPIARQGRFYGKKEKDCLYIPVGLGQRIENPWIVRQQLTNVLNPYFRKVTNEAWLYQFSYPGCSMAWMGVESQGHFFYMGQHDDRAGNCRLFVGPTKPSVGDKLMMFITHEPALKPGMAFVGPNCFVALPEGDWRDGAAIYRDFASKVLLKSRLTMQNATSGRNLRHVVMKNGMTRFYSYADLPALFRKSKEWGLDGLLIFGWWDQPVDVARPEDFISPESKSKLQDAIREIHAMDGYVSLAFHDIYPEKYGAFCLENGMDIACQDMHGQTFLPEYRYQPSGGWDSGHRARITACCHTPVWRNALRVVNQIALSCEADSVLYQALGTPTGLSCYQTTHEHGIEAGLWHAGIEKVFAGFAWDITRGTTYAYDGAACYADYILIADDISRPTADSFPQLFRHTFPEIPVVMHVERRESQDVKRDLLFAFLMGYSFDLAVDDPVLLALAGDLTKLKKRFADTMVDGRFIWSAATGLPSLVYCAEYISGRGDTRLRIFWNTGDETETVEGNLLRPNDLLFLASRDGGISFVPVLHTAMGKDQNLIYKYNDI